MDEPTLNPLLSEKTRLLIMATLASRSDPIDFPALVEKLNLTRGNLSAHIRKLEDAGFVAVEKGYHDRKPRTTYRCTEVGRKEVKRYLQSVEALLGNIK